MNLLFYIFLTSVITPFFFFFMTNPKRTLIGEKLKISLITSFVFEVIIIFMDPKILSYWDGQLSLSTPFFIVAFLFCFTVFKDKQKRKEITPTKIHRIGLVSVYIGTSISIAIYLDLFLNEAHPFLCPALNVSTFFIVVGTVLLSGLFNKFIDVANKFIHWILKGD